MMKFVCSDCKNIAESKDVVMFLDVCAGNVLVPLCADCFEKRRRDGNV